jgi:hypothetical protein
MVFFSFCVMQLMIIVSSSVGAVEFLQTEEENFAPLIAQLPMGSFTPSVLIAPTLSPRAYDADGRAPEHRSREAQRSACRLAAARRSGISCRGLSALSLRDRAWW